MILILILWIGSWEEGDPYILVRPYDEYGRQCGKEELSNYPYRWQYGEMSVGS